MERVLVTGGCGFIGSHLVDALIEEGYAVRILDSLDQQVHAKLTPRFLNPNAEWSGASSLSRSFYSLKDVDYVIHLAAQVGVGQSAYEIVKYVQNNSLGTAQLLEAIDKDAGVKKIVVASSMCIYGEGHTNQFGGPLPTREDKAPDVKSIYGLTKYDQEVQTLLFGAQHGIPTTALRLFNTYGSRQALSNPYTGVGAIFSSRYLNKKAPIIFEDGQQMRDFVHVSDVVQGFVKALKSDKTGVFNIGTGYPTTVLSLANLIKEEIGSDLEPEITKKYRAGDIRHCYPSISKAREHLGFDPKVKIEEGVKELIGWVREESAVDNVQKAFDELASRKLVK